MPRMPIVVAALALAVALATCGGGSGAKPGFCGTSTGAACSADADCARSGCSGQVCAGASEQIVTTCEWRDCYAPGPYGVTCGCSGGACRWH